MTAVDANNGPGGASRPAAAVPAFAVAGLVLVVALSGGGYSTPARTSLAIALWWGIALVSFAGIARLGSLGTAERLTWLLLALFAGWTGLSIVWAASAEKAFTELNRATLYLAVFTAVVLVARRGGAGAWSDGLSGGIVAVAVVALTSRILPTVISGDDPLEFSPGNTQRRLYHPVGYWTGLGALLALGTPLVVRAAAAARSLAGRAAAAAALPVLGTALYLTSARIAFICAAAALLVLLALAPRWDAAGAVAAGIAGSLAAVILLSRFPELVDPPLGARREHESEWTAALGVVLLCAATGAAYAAAARVLPAPRPVPRAVRRVALPAGLAMLAAAIVVADPAQRLEDFKAAPPEIAQAPVRQHLLSGSGNGRWQLWSAAVDQARSAPLHGTGAGSYEAWWWRHGSLTFPVRDAHSLYLETAGELGLVGLALLLAALACGVVFGVRRLGGTSGDRRLALAAVLSAYLAFLAAAAVDWMWELTIVGLVGVICLGLLAGRATESADAQTPPSATGWRARVAMGAAALVFAAAHGVVLVSDARVRASQDAAGRADFARAAAVAEDAVAVQPWAASPRVQLALVEEQRGRITAAREAVVAATERDREDWRLWVVRARIEREAGRMKDAARSLAEARRLNPRGQLATG